MPTFVGALFMKGLVMKKILLSLLLAASLLLSIMLVACDSKDDRYEAGESRLPVETHGDEDDDAYESDEETNSSLGVGEDTEKGWSEIHR